VTILASIGPKALYLLFLWLVSAAAASWLADRKGYGERVGLTFGLLLSVVGLAIVLLLPGRPGSPWKLDGPLPRRRSRGRAGQQPPQGPPGGAESPPRSPTDGGQSQGPAGEARGG
jgi:hypothetical protein